MAFIMLKKIWIGSIYLSLTCSALVQANNEESQSNLENKWYERSFEQLLKTKIITTSRNEQLLQTSPTSITAYSADDLKRMGIRTIKELLDRTTGFFVNQQLAGPAIGSRGFISDNEQFLLLIDGHSLNSIAEKGAGNFFLFPFLEDVERVEILRGPGSTLWGSDAALGIIHIITKSGKGLEGVKIMASTSSVDHLNYANVQAGKSISDNTNYIFSFTGARSDGFSDPYLKQSTRALPENGRWDKLGDSYEFYFKAQLDDLTIHARSVDMLNQRPGGSMVAGEVLGKIFDSVNPPTATESQALVDLYYALQKSEYYTRRLHNYIDIQHLKAINEHYNIETRLFVDRMSNSLALSNPILSPGTNNVEESGSSSETALGIENILRANISSHKLLIGFKMVQTEISPISQTVSYPTTSSASTSSSDYIRSMRVVPIAKDRNIALFAEDNWAITPIFNMIFGLRADKNSLREDSTILLPKLAFNWSINQQWLAQYAYTTGYIRPPAGIGFLGQAQQYNTSLSPSGNLTIYGAQDSEEVHNHNLSITYNNNPLEFKLGLFRTDINHSFNFLYEQATVNMQNRALYYINTNNIETTGSELEFNFIPSETWNLYGNFSYVFKAQLSSFTGSAFGVNYDLNKHLPGAQPTFGEGTFTADGDIVGYPNKIWNLGINYFINEHISGNLHYHGWTDMIARKRTSIVGLDAKKIEKYGPENFFDLNIRYEKIANTPLDIGIFVKNLLNNNDSSINMLFYTREWSERERSIGIDIAYTF